MRQIKWRQKSFIVLSAFLALNLLAGCSGNFQIETQDVSEAEDIAKEPDVSTEIENDEENAETNKEEIEENNPVENSTANQESQKSSADVSNTGKSASAAKSTGSGKTDSASQSANQKKTETDTKSANEEKTETGSQSSETAQEGIKSNVQLYEGVYFDNRRYGGDETPETVYEVHISGVTETSFDFAIYEVHDATGEQKLIFKSHTAEFTGDGTTAAYYGKEYTLQFSFPDGHGSLPKVTEMKVSGFSPVEGILFVNNSVPGHEFG